MDMHKLLEKVIVSLSSENVLSSWSVFKENNGCISLKIRYTEGSYETNDNSNSHFKRKSQRQVNRDRARQQQWRASHQTVDEEMHPDQSETVQSDTPQTPSVSDIARTITDIPQDISSVSPVVTRSMARAASKTLDTPETIRHHDMSDSPTLDTVSLDINHVSLSDTVSSVTEVGSLHDISATSHDSEAEYNPRPEHVDDTTEDDISQDDPDDIKPEEIHEWEPPPGWCWACWLKKPDTCEKHS